MGELQTG